MLTAERLNDLNTRVIGAAIEVHRVLGPGLLESAYEQCLERELMPQRISVERQVALPIEYKGLRIESGYRLDMMIERELAVELKAVEALLPIHTAQVLTYLKVAGLRLGLLLNVNVDVMRKGVKRVANRL
ncbi:MAG TPA: GxxExxY protein [Burkholderiales bacterium]|nr:GxxExxY protein [Burkholderiales bacterium]